MNRLSIAIQFMAVLTLSAVSICAQTQSREDMIREISAKRAELLKLEQAFLSPPEEDRAKYAEFLRQSDTGLVRLVPRDYFDRFKFPYRRPLTIDGGGAFYSFKERSHEYGNGTAIFLEQGQLNTVWAGANYAMLASVGEVPLENVSLETTAAQFLAQHTPPSDLPHARTEQRRWQEGATVEGISYKNRLPVRLNSTYVLRSILYDEYDALVTFKVVRVDDDDSITIVWKLLKKYPTPYLARN